MATSPAAPTWTSDKSLLRSLFERDPILFGYHLGDLDDFYFTRCRWLVEAAPVGRTPEHVVLVYEGGEIPSMLAFGESPGFENFLQAALPMLPGCCHAHFRSESSRQLRSRYRATRVQSHWKMALRSFRPPTSPAIGEIRRLRQSDRPELEALYATAYPGNWFDPSMLETGKYFGLLLSGRLVSVAGVHAVSRAERIAMLGNVVTAADLRGRGLASAATARLIADLLSEGLRIGLNVKKNNTAAIRCYERLGFEKTHEFEEAYLESLA